MIALIAFFVGTLVVSFCCSLMESVLLSTPISYISMREDEGDPNATLMMKMKEDSDRPLVAILSLNTIANTVGAAGVGHQATILLGSYWFGIMSACITIMILIFSEIIPKTIGTVYYRKFLWLAKPMRVLIFIFFPIVKFMELFSYLISRKEDEQAVVSRDEVSAMANIGEEEGVIDQSENKVIQNIIQLDNIKAYDVMTPRVVAAVASEKETLQDFYKDESLSPYSRIPVYAESPDYITGYVLRNDVLELLADDKFDTPLSEVKRDIVTFNEETSIGDIWDSLQSTKDHIAAVIDDYGSFQGVITLEDVIETILGLEIVDENDEIADMQQYARERWEKVKNERMKANPTKSLPENKDENSSLPE